MSFIEDYDVIVNKKDIFYRRIGSKKQIYNKITEKELDEGKLLNFPFINLYFSCKSCTDSIPDSKRFSRAGIIPYTIVNNKKYFCLGVDSMYGTLTDFGGGVKRYENFVEAACRELEEESLGIFNFTSKELMEKVRKNSTTIYDCNTAIIFLNVKIENINDIIDLYEYKFKNSAGKIENSAVVWIPEDIFFYLIKSGKSIKNGKNFYPSVYKVVNDLLRSVSNINEIV